VSKFFSIFLLVVSLGVSGTFGVQGGSLELGRKLFNDTTLGTTGKSCNTCHADGKDLSKAGSMNELPGIINGCIAHNLKGKALDVNSVEMKSLILYIRSLGQK
jgi:hypothetical protein